MVMETMVGEVLKKSRLLVDAVAWLDGLTPQVREQVLDMIRQDQLMEKGEDEDGDVIGYYSRATELMSGGRKLEGDHFTLNDTGDFYRSMFITPTTDGMIIDGDTQKMEDSFSQTNGYWWRNEILGLNEENLEKFARIMEGKYIEYARRTLGIDR